MENTIQINENKTMQLITERLGERNRKVELINFFEHRRQKRVALYGGLSLMAAACVAILIVFVPFGMSGDKMLNELGIVPSVSTFRSASPSMGDIDRLIDKGLYDEAIIMIKDEIAYSETEIEDLHYQSTVHGSVDAEYEEEAERVYNSELRWTYICLLVKVDDFKQARKELKRYLKNKVYCEHETEAKALLEKLND